MVLLLSSAAAFFAWPAGLDRSDSHEIGVIAAGWFGTCCPNEYGYFNLQDVGTALPHCKTHLNVVRAQSKTFLARKKSSFEEPDQPKADQRQRANRFFCADDACASLE